MLAVSVAIKPVALPLAPLPLFFSERLLSRKNLWYSLIFTSVLLTLAIIPFFLLGWTIPVAQGEWNGQFNIAGGMTVFNVAEIIQNSPMIPPALEFLGLLWVPSLIVAFFFVYRDPPRSMENLVRKAIGLVLVFFLTRSWLSEPNINLILPLMLVAVGVNMLDRRSLHLMWVVPLVFLMLNAALPQLFFLVYPSVLSSIFQFDQQFGAARLVARFAVALVWSTIAWTIAAKMLGKNKKETTQPRLTL